MKEIIVAFEDSVDDAELLRDALSEKYIVMIRPDLNGFMEFIKEVNPSLVLLDLNLSGQNGLVGLSQMMKDEKVSRIPVFIISAKKDTDDKVLGLSLGADDYLIKPFVKEELQVKVDVRIAKSKRFYTNDELKVGPISLNKSNHKLVIERADNNPEEKNLTLNEYKLVEMLLSKEDNVITREQIYDKLWGNKSEVYDRCIDNYISSIRKKISPYCSALETVYGVGYKMTRQKVA